MKNIIKKSMFALALIAGVMLFSNAKSEASLSSPKNIIQTNATADTVSLAWNPVDGAVSYTVKVYNGSLVPLVTVNATSVTLTNLSVNTSYQLYVYANDATGDESYISSVCWGKTLPSAITNFGISSIYNYITTTTFQCNSVNADGYEFIVQNYKGKTVASQSTSSTYFSVNLNKGTFYKYHVRPYILVNGTQKLYGSWTGYKFFGVPKSVTATKSGKKYVKISWSKINGAKSYTLYAGTSQTNYKKVKTFKANKRYTVLKKVKGKSIKKNKYYYYKLVAKGSFGKSTKTSHISYLGSFRYYSY